MNLTSLSPGPALRLFPLAGDAYEPTLRGGDMVMVSPTSRFLYDAVYLLDFGDGEAPYLVGRAADGYSIRHPNPKYARHQIPRAAFECAVVGIVVAEVSVKDERLIRGAHANRVAA